MHCRRRSLRQPFRRRRARGAKDLSASQQRADDLGAARRDRAEGGARGGARASIRRACPCCAACARRSGGEDACGAGKGLSRASRRQRASRQGAQAVQVGVSEGMTATPPVALQRPAADNVIDFNNLERAYAKNRFPLFREPRSSRRDRCRSRRLRAARFSTARPEKSPSRRARWRRNESRARSYRRAPCASSSIRRRSRRRRP